MKHLGFQKFDQAAQAKLETWLEQQTRLGLLPEELFQKAEHHLLDQRILLPGPSVLERLIIHICSTLHQQLFESVFQHLSPELRRAIDQLLRVSEGEQRSYFHHLKAYPPAATISSLQSYLERYQTVAATGIDDFEGRMLTPAFLEYLFKQAKRYSAKDLKRFADHKRYTLMVCFLLETRKVLLDHLVTMHDQGRSKKIRYQPSWVINRFKELSVGFQGWYLIFRQNPNTLRICAEKPRTSMNKSIANYASDRNEPLISCLTQPTIFWIGLLSNRF